MAAGIFRRTAAVPEPVASRALTDASAWADSRVIDDDIIGTVKHEERDAVIIRPRE